MKNRKGRREEGLPASCSAQPARPATGPASHRPAPPTRCSQPAARLTWPSLLPSVDRTPVSLARGHCHLGPTCRHTLPMPVRLPVSTCSRCLLDPARQRYCASSPRRAQTTVRQSPDSNGTVGQGSCPGHGPVSPLAPRPRNPS